MGFVDPVRVCQECAPVTRKEQVFFDNELKVLFKGTQIGVNGFKGLSVTFALFLQALRSTFGPRAPSPLRPTSTT